MKLELQNKLFEKYPKIFRQKDLSMRETCLCWGLECGDGWYWLIDQLCMSITLHLKSARYESRKNWIGKLFGFILERFRFTRKWCYDWVKTYPPRVEATQVKEKFGGLRFYYQGGDSEIEGMVNMAENMSYDICEACGSTDEVTQTKGWIVTLCKKCMEQRQKQ